MGNGFMFLPRDIRKWGWYKDSKMVHMLIHLMLEAQYQDNDCRGIKLKRGQLLTGRKQLSEETGLTEREVRTTIKRLANDQQITIRTTNKFSIITVCNYDSWQSLQNTNDQQTTNRITTVDQQNDHIQINNKEIEEEKDTKVSKKKTKDKSFNVREDLSYVDCFSDLWNEWLDYKDEIKKQYKTQRGAKSSFTQLKNLSGGDYFKAKAILEQSYRKSWDGFYDIKDWDSNNYPSLFSQQVQESQESKKIEWE